MKKFLKNPWAPAFFGTFLTLIQVLFLPPFAGFDEPAHFSSILSYRFNQGHPKHPGSFFHLAVEKAMTLVPSPVHQLKPWKAHGGLSYQDWTQLRPEIRQEKTNEYRSLTVTKWEDGQVFGNWQAQHPPLYYALIGNLLKLFPTDSFHVLFDSARVLSGLLFSCFYFFLAYFICVRWKYDSKILWWACFLPMPYVLGARITNDALAVPFFTWALLLLIDLLRQARESWRSRDLILLSIAFCLTLGSKSYILSMGPVLLILSLVLFYKDRHKGWLLRLKGPFFLGLPLLVMLLVWSPWLYSNWQRTGSITGMNELADLKAWGVDTAEVRLQKLKELYTVYLGGTLWIWLGVGVHLMFISHWFAGTAFPLFYIFQTLIYLGPLWLFFRNKNQRKKIFNLSSLLFVLISGAFLYGWFKFILDLYMHRGRPEWVGGWYYWATGSALIFIFAQVFAELKERTQQILVACQAAVFLWALITQFQFFSGKWDRHPVFKYPVHTSSLYQSGKVQ